MKLKSACLALLAVGAMCGPAGSALAALQPMDDADLTAVHGGLALIPGVLNIGPLLNAPLVLINAAGAVSAVSGVNLLGVSLASGVNLLGVSGISGANALGGSGATLLLNAAGVSGVTGLNLLGVSLGSGVNAIGAFGVSGLSVLGIGGSLFGVVDPINLFGLSLISGVNSGLGVSGLSLVNGGLGGVSLIAGASLPF